MKKKRNQKQDRSLSTNSVDMDAMANYENEDRVVDTDNEELSVEEADNEQLDIDDFDMDIDDIDEELAERLASYGDSQYDDDLDSSSILDGNNSIELDIIGQDDEEDEIKEFLSHDYDIIAESRRRVNQPGKRTSKDKKEKKERPRKEKAGKPKKEKVKKEKIEESGDKTKKSFLDVLKGLWDKWLEIYHGATMQILYSTLGVLAIILVISIIITSKDNKPDEAAVTTTEAQTEEPTTAPSEESTAPEEPQKVLPEAEDSEYHKLFASFIDAAYVKADMEQVKLYVDDVTNINTDQYTFRQKYFESYSNIQCYKFDSAIENSYVIVVTYDAKFKNIATPIPSVEKCIVKRADDGKLYIHNLTLQEKFDAFILEVDRAQMSEIEADVEKRMESAIASDEDLKQIMEIITSVNQNTEESTAAAQ